MLMHHLLITAALAVSKVSADCLANESLNAEFLAGAESIPKEGSCCQADVCGIPCPAELSSPGVGKFEYVV